MTAESNPTQSHGHQSILLTIRDYLIEPSVLIEGEKKHKRACSITSCILISQVILGIAAIFTTGMERGILGTGFYILFGVYAVCRTRYCTLGGIMGLIVISFSIIGLVLLNI